MQQNFYPVSDNLNPLDGTEMRLVKKVHVQDEHTGTYCVWECEHLYKKMLTELFRKNTKESVSNQIMIPEPNITTELLEQTPIEKAIYDSVLGNTQKMVELCNHILISEHHINILGNTPISLRDIHIKMTDYYNKKVVMLHTKIQKNKTKIEKRNFSVQKIQDEYRLTIEKKELLTEYLLQMNLSNNKDYIIAKEDDKFKWCIQLCNNLGKDALPIVLNSMESDIFEKSGTVFLAIPEQDTRMKYLDLRIDMLREKIIELHAELAIYNSKINIFNSLAEKLKEAAQCPICFEELEKVTKAILPCGHFVCTTCIRKILQIGDSSSNKCPLCRDPISKETLEIVKPEFINAEKLGEGSIENNINKWGTKTARLIQYLKQILSNSSNRVIVFSQWDSMLKLIGKVLEEVEISHLFLNGSIHVINGRIRKFKIDTSIRVVLLSSDKAVSGLNLTEASHIVLLDTLNTSDKASVKMIEEQAIGRAVRLGQNRNVEVKRFIMKNTIEEDFYQKYIECRL